MAKVTAPISTTADARNATGTPYDEYSKNALDVHILGDVFSKCITFVDESSSTITYLGFSLPGSLTSSPVWLIQKVETTGSITSVLNCDGDSLFDNIWDNRASLSYS